MITTYKATFRARHKSALMGIKPDFNCSKLTKGKETITAQSICSLYSQSEWRLRRLYTGQWIRRIELIHESFITREETSKYTEPVERIRQFSFDMDAHSIITFPSYPSVIKKGWREIHGIAWGGHVKINILEVLTDVGNTWASKLQESMLDKAHEPSRYLWNWNRPVNEIMRRWIDTSGYIQPTLSQLVQ